MQRLEGSRILPYSAEQLWNKLSDMQFVVSCIPDVAAVSEVTEKTANLTLRPGFSFVRGELQVNLERTGEAAPTSLTMVGRSKGVGSSSEVEATLHLQPGEGQTQLHWQAEIKQLGGLLKAVPQGLIQAASQRVLDDVMAGVEKRLAVTT